MYMRVDNARQDCSTLGINDLRLRRNRKINRATYGVDFVFEDDDCAIANRSRPCAIDHDAILDDERIDWNRFCRGRRNRNWLSNAGGNRIEDKKYDGAEKCPPRYAKAHTLIILA